MKSTKMIQMYHNEKQQEIADAELFAIDILDRRYHVQKNYQKSYQKIYQHPMLFIRDSVLAHVLLDSVVLFIVGGMKFLN